MNEFADALKSLSANTNIKGTFRLMPGESINLVVTREKVPNGRGVYLIFDLCHPKQPIYVGKAGTIYRDGKWSNQGIRGRLVNVQKKMRRVDFFRGLMGATCTSGLEFHWFITHENNGGRLPALVEMQLIQAHLDEFGSLPEHNESA
jgi:hypothetical protein